MVLDTNSHLLVTFLPNRIGFCQDLTRQASNVVFLRKLMWIQMGIELSAAWFLLAGWGMFNLTECNHFGILLTLTRIVHQHVYARYNLNFKTNQSETRAILHLHPR